MEGGIRTFLGNVAQQWSVRERKAGKCRKQKILDGDCSAAGLLLPPSPKRAWEAESRATTLSHVSPWAVGFEVTDALAALSRSGVGRAKCLPHQVGL